MCPSTTPNTDVRPSTADCRCSPPPGKQPEWGVAVSLHHPPPTQGVKSPVFERDRQAGNTTTKTVTFHVATSTNALESLVSLFTNNGWISNGGVSQALTKKLATGSLHAFINQVEAQDGKHISPVAVQYRLRDADFLLGPEPN